MPGLKISLTNKNTDKTIKTKRVITSIRKGDPYVF